MVIEHDVADAQGAGMARALDAGASFGTAAGIASP
jgi:hypothetical protein